MIELEQLREMFANIQAEAHWDMAGPMLWGYFFTDRSPEKLQALVPILERQGYRLVDLYQAELDDDGEEDEDGEYEDGEYEDDSAEPEDHAIEAGDADLAEGSATEDQEIYFILHVEKEEAHSPESLHERNAQLDALAALHGLDSYDGMDVGPLARS